MFDEVGKKIKLMVKVFFWLESTASIIVGIVMIVIAANEKSYGRVSTIMGLGCLVIGPLIAWLSSLILYGFGELVDKVTYIYGLIKKENKGNSLAWDNSSQERRHNTPESPMPYQATKEIHCTNCGKLRAANLTRCPFCGISE